MRPADRLSLRRGDEDRLLHRRAGGDRPDRPSPREAPAGGSLRRPGSAGGLTAGPFSTFPPTRVPAGTAETLSPVFSGPPRAPVPQARGAATEVTEERFTARARSQPNVTGVPALWEGALENPRFPRQPTGAHGCRVHHLLDHPSLEALRVLHVAVLSPPPGGSPPEATTALTQGAGGGEIRPAPSAAGQ